MSHFSLVITMIAWLCLGEKILWAADAPKAADSKKMEEEDNVIKRPKEETPPEVIVFSNDEIEKACKKWNGKYISIHGEVFRVEQCKRHPVPNAEDVFAISRKNTIQEVEATDVAPIPLSSPTGQSAVAKPRDCKMLNHSYVTFSYTDIYFVEKCEKHLLPDWETYLSHRAKNHVAGSEIVSLTSEEFYNLKSGIDVESVMDKEFAKLRDGSANIDIIPVDEACKGVEGKTVSFYSRLYRIEKCHKREIDPEKYSKAHFRSEATIVELRSEQWLSLPDGVPMDRKE